MNPSRSAIVTVAFGRSTEHLDYTFTSFAKQNPGVPLHAFIIGTSLPQRQLPGIEYHLVAPQTKAFVDPLREIYFRRMELIDELNVDYALVVDSYDVLCLQPLHSFEKILSGCDVAACVEHAGSRFSPGQGYTSNFLNGGVFFWNVPGSRDIRYEITARGRDRFRTTADDQYAINEVIQTKYYSRLRILSSHYNFRPFFGHDWSSWWRQNINFLPDFLRSLPILRYLLPPLRLSVWPSVSSLDGVLIYHNATTMKCAKQFADSGWIKARAELPPLAKDEVPISSKFDQSCRKLETLRDQRIA